MPSDHRYRFETMAPVEIEWRSNGSLSAKRFKGRVSLCNNILFVNGSKFREYVLTTAPELEGLQSMRWVLFDGAKRSIKFDSGLDATVIKENVIGLFVGRQRSSLGQINPYRRRSHLCTSWGPMRH